MFSKKKNRFYPNPVAIYYRLINIIRMFFFCVCSKQEKIQTSFFIHSNCSTTNTEVEIERKKLF